MILIILCCRNSTVRESFGFRSAEYDKPFNYYRYAGKNLKCYQDIKDPRNPVECVRLLDDYKYSGRECDNHFGDRCPNSEKCFEAICEGDKMKFFKNKCHKLEYPYSNNNWHDSFSEATKNPEAAFNHLKRYKVDSKYIGYYDTADYDNYVKRMNYDGKWNDNNNLKLVMMRNLKCPAIKNWPKPFPYDNRHTYGGKDSFHLNNIYNSWKVHYEKPREKCEVNSSGDTRNESCNHGKYIKDQDGIYKSEYNNACEYINTTLPSGKDKCETTFSWDVKTGRYYHCELNNDKCIRKKRPCILTKAEQCRTDTCFTTLCKPKGLSKPDAYTNVKNPNDYNRLLNKQYNDYKCEELYDIEGLRKSIQNSTIQKEKLSPWQVARSCVKNSDDCADIDNNTLHNIVSIEDAASLLGNDSTYRVVNASLKDHYKDKDDKKTLKCTDVKSASSYAWPLEWQYGYNKLNN